MDFSHIHLHNEFSYLDGFGTAEAYVKAAKGLGFNYLGCTNHGNIDGLLKFQKACEKEKIDPILGCEAYIVPDMSKKEKGEKRGHVILLVKNATGWQNLCQMLTKANLEGFYYRPRIDYASLLDHCEGLVILTGCSMSFLHLPGGVQLFDHLQAIIGKDLYLEVMPHHMEDQIKINNLCIELSQQYSVPIVATNDCHYIRASDAEAQEVLLAMQTKAKWTDADRYKFNIKGLHLRTANEMRIAFKEQGVFNQDEIDSALDWTEDIYEKCKFKIAKQNISLPKVPGHENEDPCEFIWKLAFTKLHEIGDGWTEEKLEQYATRLDEEWKLINEKGFMGYFCIIKELVDWCKKNKIATGPGRGSVSGSLLAYLLGITCVDPLKYNLLFSRFIAEDRIDFPDIDMDYEDRKRYMVREHLESLYGKNHIASLSTFMSMKGRGTVRDVCRVFDVPLSEVDVFAKSVHEDPDSDNGVIEGALKSDAGRQFMKDHSDLAQYMVAVEGQVKAAGQHPAALIVSSEDLRDGTRCNLAIRSNEIVCNWDMKDSEYVGLMKLDVLGLNTLSVLNETKTQIANSKKLFLYHPESSCYFVGDELDLADGLTHEEDFDFEKIPLNDKRVYQSIYEGNTVGVFQLSAGPTTNLAKQIKATNINELSDIIALVRPGPFDSGSTKSYIERKNNGIKWTPKHPIYEEITKNTYGIIVYQEQVMEVIHKVAGLSYTTADKIRKVISKKRDAKEFKPYEDAFVEGCLKMKTLSQKEAKEFWKMLQAHVHYSFNLSHSCAYAMLGYWTAWTKMYFPVEFMCASLTYGSEGKKEEMVEEAFRMGLEIVPPKIGISDPLKWTSKEGKLYVPFIEIKGFGEKMAMKCAEIRPSNVVLSKSSNLKGFFFPKSESEEDLVGKANKSKMETVLTAIGAYGGNPTGDISQYFSFQINKKASVQKFKEIDGDSKGSIKEISFTPKKSLSRCSDCELKKECSGPVHASPGHFNVSIIGESPGRTEDEKKECFVGPAGKVVWDELAKYELKRDDFHTSNVCKCFIDPNIEILTSKGIVKICDIKVGDLVLTHKGKFRKVVWIRPEEYITRRAKLVRIKYDTKLSSKSATKTIFVTPEHPFMVDGKWVPSNQLKVGDQLKVLAKKCAECGRDFPFCSKSDTCSHSCSSKHSNKKRVWTLESLNKKSLSMKKVYEAGIINSKENTKNAHKKTKEKIEDGTFHLITKNRTFVADRKGLTKYNSKRIRLACEKTFETNKRLGHIVMLGKTGKAALAKYYETHECIFKSKNKGTKIENVMAWALKKVGMKNFVQNKCLFRHYPDIMFEEEKIIVECDGAHWHHDKEKEKVRDSIFEQRGFTVLHFTDKQILEDVFACTDEISRVIKNHRGEYSFSEVNIVAVKETTNYGKRRLYNFGVEKDESYIANGLVSHNCFPSISKTPKPNQIKICSEKWLFEELKEIDCKLILAFGNTCLFAFTGRSGGIKEMNGKTEWNEKIGAWICWCMHPSSVLHDARNKPLFEAGIKNFIDKIEALS